MRLSWQTRAKYAKLQSKFTREYRITTITHHYQNIL
jgi:hypothetical protein